MSDLRLFPRVTCDFPVYDLSYSYIGRTIEICLDGLLIESASNDFQDLNSEKIIVLFLGDQKELVKVKVVPLKVENNGSGSSTITFSFVELSPRSDELISNFLIRSIWGKALTPFCGEGEIHDGFLSILDNKEEIVQILSDLTETNTTFFSFQEEGINILPMTLEKIEQDSLIFKSNTHTMQVLMHDGRKTYLTVMLRHSGYLIVSEEPVIKGQKLITPLPRILFASDRRSNQREKVSDPNMLVCIPLPYPPGALLHRKIIDISSKGISFRSTLNNSYFLPGTPISNLKVLGKKEFITKAEVRHISPIIENGKATAIKVGVSFIDKEESFLTGKIKTPSSNNVSCLVKTGSDVFKEIIHFVKGFAVQSIYLAQKGMFLGSRNYKIVPPRVDIIRIRNDRNEEIVGILNTTWETMEKRNANVIIIPPAFGRRKESTGTLALALIENFKRVGEDLVIIRFDGINNLGESYKEPIYRQASREAVGFTLSQACDDLSTVVAFARNNNRFATKKLVLLAFSLATVPARRLLAQNALGEVNLCIMGMGVSCTQEVVKNTSGGIDYIGNQAKKIYGGETTILGVTIDQSIFGQDAIDNKMAFMEDAIADMRQISTPVVWVLGESDAWTEVSQIKKLLDAHKEGKGQIHMLKMGHVPMNGLDAIRLFNTIIGILSENLFEKKITPVFPMPGQLDDIRIREWDRAPRYPLVDPERYWAGYLLGEEKEDEGYDTLWLCEDYVNFLEDEYNALDLRANHRVADMGCGTGNFGELLIKRHLNGKRPFPDLTLVDFVPEALERAKAKYQSLLGGINNTPITFHLFDLEINRLIPVKQFLEGQFFSLDKFKCKIKGLYDDTIELWNHHYSEVLHQILRGKSLGTVEIKYLKETFSREEINFIKDINLAARFLNKSLRDEDFSHKEKLRKGVATTNMLKFHALDFGNSSLNFSLPFTDNQFDRIMSSLVLSYLKNPDVTFAEYVRCLKPGGRLVISSMKPDADPSTMYTRLIQTVSQSNQYPEEEKSRLLMSIRSLANSVAFLMTLVEECQFRFFSKEEMLDFANSNDLKEVELIESYGNPPQAYILTGVK